MHGGQFLEYALAAALAIGLLHASWTDWRRREIDNWLNAAILLLAPLYWYADPSFDWLDAGFQIAVAVVTFAVLLGLFALGQMGGGDVKLLTVLALWFAPLRFMQLMLVMAIAGLVITVALFAWHRATGRKDRIKVPYGIAISAGGLWVLADKYLPVLPGGGQLG